MSNAEERWRRYLFAAHDEGTLRLWARRLAVFRFFRAHGGHANDGDALEAAFRYGSADDLARLLDHLGVAPGGQGASPVPDAPGLRQPGWCDVRGVPVFVWATLGVVRLSIASGYEVTQADVERAASIEPLLATAPLERVDPPRDDRHYVSPKHYPDFFR